MKRIQPAVGFLFFCLFAGSIAQAGKLEDGFHRPPDSARPRTWWHWVSGNVSTSGITADLEAMKKIGLAGFQLFSVDQSNVKGPILFMSPEWRGFVKQSLAEADRLGLEVSIEGCEGWSESGGPWIDPARAMQKIVTTERHVDGGQKVKLDLPKPETIRDYYEDIALIAFPALQNDRFGAAGKITATLIDGPEGALMDDDLNTKAKFNPKANDPLQIDIEFEKSIAPQSLRISADRNLNRTPATLEVSEDGKTFVKVAAISLEGSFTFPPASGKFFRITATRPPSKPFSIAEITFGGLRLGQFSQRSGIAVSADLAFPQVEPPADQVIDPRSIVDLTGKTEWDVPNGAWTIVRIGHTCTGVTTHPSATAGLECDKLSRDAVRFHLDQMFGPIFTDSPGQAGKALRYILLDSWEAGCGNWTPLMREEFKKRRGYDIAPWQAVFTGRIVQNAEMTERFLWDYRRTIADLITENHYGEAQKFAHEHNMGLYAEASGIGLPTVADQLACKGRTDIPMGEFWLNRKPAENIDDPKETASAAHIYGQNIAAAESFTATANVAGWKSDPYSLKLMGDAQFCLGINRYVFHRYAHQPWEDRKPGMSMGPWGINFERTNTWWDKGNDWIDYISRSQFLLQQGRFVADLLYFYGESAPVGMNSKKLSPAVPPGFDYDICNAEILLEHASVEDGLIVLKSGMRYRVLVLPQTDRMTLPMLKKIQSLAQAGATIYGPRPKKSPSLSDGAEADLAIQKLAQEIWEDCDGQNATWHNYGKGRICCGPSLEAVLGIAPDFQASQPDVQFIHRTDGEADIYFVSNQSLTNRTIDCTFRVNGKSVELWHADTGRIERPAIVQSVDGRTQLPIRFDPAGSVFVVFRGADPMPHVASIHRDNLPLAADASLPVLAGDSIEMLVTSPGRYELGLSDGKAVINELRELSLPVIVEGSWTVSFPPKLGAPEKATFEKLVSWTASKEDGIKYFSGSATYSKEITVAPGLLGKQKRVLLDLGEVKNLADVVVNGKRAGRLWKPPFRVDITEFVHEGTNAVQIEITNLWPNRMIGDLKLPEDKRITWASIAPYKADAPLLPSGLLGPVRIVPAEVIVFPLPEIEKH